MREALENGSNARSVITFSAVVRYCLLDECPNQAIATCAIGANAEIWVKDRVGEQNS